VIVPAMTLNMRAILMSTEYMSIGEAADELTRELGQTIRPRWITDLFYDRELRDDLCPIVGGAPPNPPVLSARHLGCHATERLGWGMKSGRDCETGKCNLASSIAASSSLWLV